LHFTHGDQLYRVCMPNQSQLNEANNERNIKIYQLLKTRDENGQPVYLTTDQLKGLLKQSLNIDIDQMDQELEALKNQIIQKHADLARFSDEEVDRIEKCKQEIQELKDARTKIIIEKAEYLAPSIQMQSDDTYYKSLTRLCTEKYIEEGEADKKTGKFIKVWKNLSECLNDESLLPNVALGKFTKLFFSM